MLAILLASIPSLVISFLMPNIIVSIIAVIVYCPIDGYIAKNIAQEWIDEDMEDARLS